MGMGMGWGPGKNVRRGCMCELVKKNGILSLFYPRRYSKLLATLLKASRKG